MKKHVFHPLILLSMMTLVFFGCGESSMDDEPKSNIRSIMSFIIKPAPNAGNVQTQHQGVIDETNKTITIKLPQHLDLTAVRPSIIAGPWATVYPQNLEAVDFTADIIEYTVTAQSGKQAVYTVIKDMSYRYSQAQIYALSFPAIIDSETGEPVRALAVESDKTIRVEVPKGTDVTHLTPLLELSPDSYNAVFTQSWNTPQDFTDPVSYTLTSEDGNKTVKYTVTVTEKQED